VVEKTAVVEKTLRQTPPAATHWSTLTMAHAVGLSLSAQDRNVTRRAK